MSYTIYLPQEVVMDECENITLEIAENRLRKELNETKDENLENELEALEEELSPKMNFYHILKYVPSNKNIEKLEKLTHNVSIVNCRALETFLIGLNSVGADFSEYIELAYRILDGDSPIIARDIIFLPNEAKKELLKLRKEQLQVKIEDFKNILKELGEQNG